MVKYGPTSGLYPTISSLPKRTKSFKSFILAHKESLSTLNDGAKMVIAIWKMNNINNWVRGWMEVMIFSVRVERKRMGSHDFLYVLKEKQRGIFRKERRKEKNDAAWRRVQCKIESLGESVKESGMNTDRSTFVCLLCGGRSTYFTRVKCGRLQHSQTCLWLSAAVFTLCFFLDPIQLLLVLAHSLYLLKL